MYRKEIIKKNREYRRRQRRAYRLATLTGLSSISMIIISMLAVCFQSIDVVRGFIYMALFSVTAGLCSACAAAVWEE